VLLHDLGEHNELVIDALPFLALFYALGGKAHKILAFDLIDVPPSCRML
jgi:hypothetical protein